MFDLTGKWALVTGASSGLGAHFARILASQGASLILTARREARLTQFADALRAQGSTALVLPMDVTSKTSVDESFRQLAEQGICADILVNNSGVSREDWIAYQDEADWDLIMDTNLKGAWRVAKMTAQALIQAEKPGSIVNIASITAFRSSQKIAAYGASKAAIVHLTQSMALEWARFGIRVNALAPGYFSTEMNADYLNSELAQKMIRRIPLRRTGELDELSGPLLLLASEAGAYMTGSVLTVDGGHLQSAL